MNFQYFISVVPTDVQTSAGFTYNTFQYSVKDQVGRFRSSPDIWAGRTSQKRLNVGCVISRPAVSSSNNKERERPSIFAILPQGPSIYDARKIFGI